jgi:hypothetical protein
MTDIDHTVLLFNKALSAEECEDVTRLLRVKDVEIIKWQREEDGAFNLPGLAEKHKEIVYIAAELGDNQRLAELSLVIASLVSLADSFVSIKYGDCYVGKIADWVINDAVKRQRLIAKIDLTSAVIMYSGLLRSGDDIVAQMAHKYLDKIDGYNSKEEILSLSLDELMRLEKDLVIDVHSQGHIVKSTKPI